jgi:hypothetical protein
MVDHIGLAGWSARAPRRSGGERGALLAECGDRCFLMPGVLKFPICARRGRCRMDCGGVQAAIMRARQWGYNDVENRARALQDKHCKGQSSREDAKKKRRRPPGRRPDPNAKKNVSRRSKIALSSRRR